MSNYFDHLLLLGRIAVLRTQMRPIVTNRVAWSVDRLICLSVCHSSEPCEFSKTTEPTEMPFVLRIRVDLRDHALDGVLIQMGRSNFEGKGGSFLSMGTLCLQLCKKTGLPILTIMILLSLCLVFRYCIVFYMYFSSILVDVWPFVAY